MKKFWTGNFGPQIFHSLLSIHIILSGKILLKFNIKILHSFPNITKENRFLSLISALINLIQGHSRSKIQKKVRIWQIKTKQRES